MLRQLNLFGGKRQRGVKLPPAKEYQLHTQLADLLRRWVMPGWKWTHLPFGEYRDPITAGRLKRMGVSPGWPDFVFVGANRVFFLELKRKGFGLSEAQGEVAEHLIRNGCGYLVTDDLKDALDTLRDMGIVRASVSA